MLSIPRAIARRLAIHFTMPSKPYIIYHTLLQNIYAIPDIISRGPRCLYDSLPNLEILFNILDLYSLHTHYTKAEKELLYWEKRNFGLLICAWYYTGYPGVIYQITILDIFEQTPELGSRGEPNSCTPP